MAIQAVLRRVRRLAAVPRRYIHTARARKAEPWKGTPFYEAEQPAMTFEQQVTLAGVIGGSTVAGILLCFKEDLSPYRWAEKVAEEELEAELGPHPTKN